MYRYITQLKNYFIDEKDDLDINNTFDSKVNNVK